MGCELPIQLAAMGGVGTLELAAAVASAGGLGMVPGYVEMPGEGGGAVGKNFLAVFNPDLDVVSAAARRTRVVEFFYAWPDRRYVEAVCAEGGIAAWQVGSTDEALAAQEAGCHFVIAQGIEAGGHVRGTTPLAELLPATVAAVSIPVVAAGGIATARHVAQLIRLGAAGVRIGTAFVATDESGAHPLYMDALVAATVDDTVLTTHYAEGWPDAPHRVLRSSLEAAEVSGWRATVPPTRAATEGIAAMAMYAGMGVGEVKRVRPACDVVADLCGEL